MSDKTKETEIKTFFRKKTLTFLYHRTPGCVEDLNVIIEPKCNKLLNVITFDLKCNKLLSVTTLRFKYITLY